MSMAHANLRKMIEEFGWTAVMTETEDGHPFIYTIGLEESYNHPEVFISGMGRQGKDLLDIVVHFIADDGRQFGDGEIANDVIVGRDGEPMPVKFVDTSMHCRINYMCQAYYHNEEKDFKAIQMLWPDTQNKFPDDEEFEEKFKSRQRLLVEPTL